MTDLGFRFYQAGDDEQIVELLRRNFSVWTSMKDPLGFWKWKYLDTPQPSIITVVEDEKQIVGCNHSLFFKCKLDSEMTSISYGGDLAIDSEYRGRGLWAQMSDFKRKNKPDVYTKYTYSATANPVVLKSWKNRDRSRFPYTITRMVKIRDVDHYFRMKPRKNEKFAKLGYHSLRVLNSVQNPFTPDISSSSDFQIERISKFDYGGDVFWEKVQDDYDFILEKSERVLNWRLCDSRGGNFFVLQAVGQGEILGFIAVKLLENEGLQESQVVDLLALKGRSDVVAALIKSACDILDGMSINAIYYQVVRGHSYQSIFKKFGFIDSQSQAKVSLNYTQLWVEHNKEFASMPFLQYTSPNRLYFNYAEVF